MESSSNISCNRPKIVFVRGSTPATRFLSLSPVLQAAAEAKAEPQEPLNKSKWTCTLCLTTMAPKDITAHKQGKRHMAALAKVDGTLPVKLKSECFKAGAYDAEDTGVKSSMFSQSPTKAQKINGKTAAKPRKGIKSIVPPSTSAVVDDQRLDGEHNGWFIDSFPSNTSIGSTMKPFSAARFQSVPYVRSTFAIDNDPLAAFFSLHSSFEYNRYSSSHDEYRRLCAFFGWPSRKQEYDHAERDEAWKGFRIAMVKAFNMTFGDDENDMEAWERMCVLVGMEHIPDTLVAQREAMIQTHVNLCDLLDTTRQRSKVQVFASEKELRDYTLKTGRVFPRVKAYEGGLLKYLLREITGTYHGNRRTGEGRKRKDERKKKRITNDNKNVVA